MAKIIEKEHIMTQEELEEPTPAEPTPEPEPEEPTEPTEPNELGITLPDEAATVEQIADTDRLLGFDTDGNPTTATAEQLAKYARKTIAEVTPPVKELTASDRLLGLAANAGLVTVTAEQVKEYAAEGLASTEELAEVLDGVFKTIGNGINADDAKQGAGYSYSAGTPAHGTVATFKGLPASGSYGVLQLFCDNQESSSARFWVRNNNQQGFTPWRELWHSGNLTSATAASVGLMSASDKIKLNAVASAMSLMEDEPATMALDDKETVSPEVSIRAQRSAQYQMQTDELLYDALETFARNHPEHAEFTEWLAAKDRIRAELLKPETLNFE